MCVPERDKDFGRKEILESEIELLWRNKLKPFATVDEDENTDHSGGSRQVCHDRKRYRADQIRSKDVSTRSFWLFRQKTPQIVDGIDPSEAFDIY